MRHAATALAFLLAITVCLADDAYTDKSEAPSQTSEEQQKPALTEEDQRLAEAEKTRKLDELMSDMRTAEANQKAANKSHNREAIEKAKNETAFARKQLNTFKRLTDAEWLDYRTKRMLSNAEAAKLVEEIKATRPLAFKGAVLRKNVISLPELWVTMVNETDTTIEAYTIIAECFTKFDEPVRAIDGTTQFVGLAQARIEPKQDGTSHWQMSLYRSTGYVNVWISRIKYANGTEWTQTREQAADRGKNFRRVDIAD